METMVAILMLIMVICFAIIVKLMTDMIYRERISADRWRDTALLQQRIKDKLEELTR